MHDPHFELSSYCYYDCACTDMCHIRYSLESKSNGICGNGNGKQLICKVHAPQTTVTILHRPSPDQQWENVSRMRGNDNGGTAKTCWKSSGDYTCCVEQRENTFKISFPSNCSNEQNVPCTKCGCKGPSMSACVETEVKN